ncbi:ABC transporter permease [Blastochloris sulfoviridis]|uniref:FtsX-like permease family protein n=1 Tax=Blastochloris sulfoviridis TaxID=50712 RepID=A0A5M6HZ21_9HYPH|nr:FtsX-like permease family protein [Blastochloris sulfoviridis]KAA5601176.1 FtsX-like permease family protein [Blastochloris sulfoviridis]
MSAFVPAAGGGFQASLQSLRLAFRLALRELRGGIKGFRIFLACIALGVTAIAGVGSVSKALTDGIAREGRTILGADVSFSLIHREASAAEQAFFAETGTADLVATMRGMARKATDSADGASTLVEMKAVGPTYPRLGALKLDPPLATADLLVRRDGAFGAAADPALLSRLGLKPGERLVVGAATFEVRALVVQEPDQLAGGIGFGPRLLIGEDGLRATGLVQPGSLVRWTYRLLLPQASDAAARAVAAAAAERFPQAGWEVRTRANASPQLERQIERFTQFLTFVGLTALIVGGVGVAGAVKSYMDKKREVIATFKTLGATGARVFAIYLAQVLLLGGLGVVIGLGVGAGLPFVVSGAFGALIPIPLAPALYPGVLGLAALYGLVTALAFALWPLGRAHDVPVSALFRDMVAPERRWPRRRYIALTGAAAAALAALAILTSGDPTLAAVYVGAAGAVFLLLRLVASGIMALARRLPPVRSTELRLALANIHRPGAVTPSVVLSLGLGLALLVTLAQIDSNLRRQFTASLPERAPSFFFVDIPNAEAGRFDAFVRGLAPDGTLTRVPMLRGRLVSLGGRPVETIEAPQNVAWVLSGDRGITYAETPPEGSRVVAGDWWPAGYAGPPLVSMEKRIADAFGLKVGDRIVVNVLGRNIEATLSNLRALEWDSLGINFVMVFSPSAFRGAPHTHLATLALPNGGAGELAVLTRVAAEFPTVTTVRVKDALAAVNDLVGNLIAGIRGASTVTLIAAVLVLAGALAAGHRHRVYDAVILKTLGATRGRLLKAYGLEYAMLGAVTATFGVLAGSLAGWAIVSQAMRIAFVWDWAGALVSVAAALVLTVAFGLIGTWRALGERPAPVLRHL